MRKFKRNEEELFSYLKDFVCGRKIKKKKKIKKKRKRNSKNVFEGPEYYPSRLGG